MTRGGFQNWLPVFFWMSLIFLGSSIPHAVISPTGWVDFLLRKLLHLFEYAVLTILFCRALGRSDICYFKFISESNQRNSKFEIRGSKQIRNPKFQIRNVSNLGFGAWDLFGISDFVLRILERHQVLRLVSISLAFTTLYAVSDEFHQSFVPGRTGCWRDVLVDGLGAVIGLAVYCRLLCDEDLMSLTKFPLSR